MELCRTQERIKKRIGLFILSWMALSADCMADQLNSQKAHLHIDLIRACYEFFDDAKKDKRLSSKYGIVAMDEMLSQLKYAQVITSNLLDYHIVYIDEYLIERRGDLPPFIKEFNKRTQKSKKLDGIPLRSCYFTRKQNKMFFAEWRSLQYYFEHEAAIPTSKNECEEDCKSPLHEGIERGFTSWPIYRFLNQRLQDSDHWEFLTFKIKELDLEAILEGMN